MASIIGYFNLNNHIPRPAVGLSPHALAPMLASAGKKPPATKIAAAELKESSPSQSISALKPPLFSPHKQKKGYNAAGESKSKPAKTANEFPDISLWEQAVLYLATVAGVLLSSAATRLSSETVSPNITTTTIIFSLIIAFALIPSAFGNLKLYQNPPIFFRIGLFVQHGVFWQVIFGAIGKVI